jgi:hypothetical protein
MHTCNCVLLFQITEGNHDVSFDRRVGFTLTLHKITDSGDFVCKAVQGTTEQEVTFHVIINRKCVIHVEWESLCLQLAGCLVLQCSASCYGMVKNKCKAFQHNTKYQLFTGDLKMEMLNRRSIPNHDNILQVVV